MKASRRELLALASATLVAAEVAPRAGAQPPSAGPLAIADAVKAARDTVRGNAEALAKFDLPMTTEPAFQFKP